jgi:spore germination protein GerM
VRDTELRQDTLVVDFERVGLGGGSLQERLLVESLVRTLTALPGVRRVRFLVDGKAAETLMGHVDVTKPISPNDL